MSPSRRILVVAQRPSDFTEMIRCARELSRRGHHVHLLYHFLTSDQRFDRPVVQQIEESKKSSDIEDATLVDFGTVLRSRKRRERKERKAAKPNRPPRFPLLARVVNGTVRFMKDLNTPYMCLLYLRLYRYYDALLRQLRTEIIILPEDVVGMVTPMMIRAGHRNNVPSLILPYTIANQQEAFTSLSGNPDFQSSILSNRIAGLVFPRWRMQAGDIDIVRLPARHIVAHEFMRASPPDPWMMNSGYANMIGVESQAMHSYYRAAGIPESKLRVVGAVYDDVLAGYLANRAEELAAIRRELGIAGDKPLLLIGGCPNQLTADVPHCEFAAMEEIADFIAGCLRPLQDDFEIIIRPHPNFPELGEMLRQHGFHATFVDTARMIAVCDLYVAFASATIRWAIACGVPTVNYDVFGYGYDDFKGIGGILNVAGAEEFRRTAGQLRRSGPEYQAASREIARERTKWSMTDGRSMARIEELIEELAGLKVVPRTTR